MRVVYWTPGGRRHFPATEGWWSSYRQRNSTMGNQLFEFGAQNILIPLSHIYMVYACVLTPFLQHDGGFVLILVTLCDN